MNDPVFTVFPSENFVDMCLYQFGREQCPPAYSFGPATRNHYLFHYVLSGTGRLLTTDSKGEPCQYQIRSGEGFMIFPGRSPRTSQMRNCRGNTHGSNLTGCAREK